MRTVGGCTLDWLTSGTEIETDAKRKKESVHRMSKAPAASECMSKAKSDGAVRLCEAWCEGVRRMGTRDDSTDRCALLFKVDRCGGRLSPKSTQTRCKDNSCAQLRSVSLYTYFLPIRTAHIYFQEDAAPPTLF
jgi:hypothetical protein